MQKKTSKKTCENFKVNNLATFLGKLLAKNVAKLLTLNFDQKTLKSAFQDQQKTYFYSVLETTRQKQQNRPKKQTITFAHATITCLV